MTTPQDAMVYKRQQEDCGAHLQKGRIWQRLTVLADN